MAFYFLLENNCTKGFPDIPVFSEENIAEELSLLIPDMNFTCNQTIAAVTIAAVIRFSSRVSMISIQIWRGNYSQSGSYYKVGSPLPVDSIVCDVVYFVDNRIYACILDRDYWISVQPGDILGLDILPAVYLDLLFTKGGPTNYIFDRPLNSTIDLLKSNSTMQQLPQLSFGFTSGIKKNALIV